VVQSLRERGFFCCVSTFPAVPMNKPSIRFTVSRHNSLADLRLLIDQLADVNAAPREIESGSPLHAASY
jgi:7-keto-8-aminopelargonate synthetase-like enzyme